jgi:toxic protein SymE
VKITDGGIVLVLDSEEVNGLKYEKESLRQQLREIKQANKNIKTTLKIMVG